jgi:alpha/beta hydrolase family protein
MRPVLATVVVGVSGSLLTAYAGSGEPPAKIPTHSQEWYQHHILAVDEDGNGLLPAVSISGPANDPRYNANHRQKISGEDTRNAFLKNGQMSPGLKIALQGRAPLMDYVSAMFRAIGEQHPTEVIVYIHGGLNNIDGAIAKSAMLADRLDVDGKFFIGICWNSNLMPTYDQHLLAVREGLHQKEKAIVTAPAMLLADVGGSVVRLPLNLIDFLYQDAYVLRPSAFTRTKLAKARYDQINKVYKDRLKTNLQRLDVSKEEDQRSNFQKWFRDFGRWLITEPVKASSTVFLDTLGVQPWKNMVRRTRTMFERESEFIPDLNYDAAGSVAGAQVPPVPTPQFIDQLNYTGRKGAVWHFTSQLEANLIKRNSKNQPTLTIIGHSMGAIVTCEMLERFHRLAVDNVVLMAAACSIRDFKDKIIPFFQEQELRADFAKAAPGQAKLYAPLIKTHLYNLCLNDTAEHIEPNPGQLDLSQRGSLLTWIDTLYQSPESENDRTFGRWVNAVLSTDDIPSNLLGRISIKSFGMDRPRKEGSPVYTELESATKVIDEPTKHGEFTRYNGPKKQTTNFRFWNTKYRVRERDKSAGTTH